MNLDYHKVGGDDSIHNNVSIYHAKGYQQLFDHVRSTHDHQDLVERDLGGTSALRVHAPDEYHLNWFTSTLPVSRQFLLDRHIAAKGGANITPKMPMELRHWFADSQGGTESYYYKVFENSVKPDGWEYYGRDLKGNYIHRHTIIDHPILYF